MTVREESYNKPDGDTDISSGDVKFTSSEDVDELILLFSSEKKTNLALLDHLFSVQFSESEEFRSFFNRLFSSREQIAPLLWEISNFEALSPYFEKEKWSNHPMIAYASYIYYLLVYNFYNENPEYPVENWRWLDYFLNRDRPSEDFNLDDWEDYAWDQAAKDSLSYAALHCDLETETDKFMEYYNRALEILGRRRDVIWSNILLGYRKEGKTLTEISKIDPWENY